MKTKYFAIISVMTLIVMVMSLEAEATSYGFARARFDSVQPHSDTRVHVGSSFTYQSWQGAGVYNYKLDTDHATTNWYELYGPGNNIVDLPGFCIELGQRVNGWATYEVVSADEAPRPGNYVPGTPPPGMGTAKADQLSEFWGRYGPAYNDWGSWAGSSSSRYAEAFQLGLWEIIYESSGTLNVSSGYFRASSSRIDWWVGGVPQVNNWLSTLDGNGPRAELRALTHGSYQDLLVVVPPHLPQQPVVPEPLTAMGMFIGIGTLANYLRRRR